MRFHPANVFGLLALMALVACGPAPTATGINDPFEERNRATHEFNKTIDKNILRPIASKRKPGPPGMVGRTVGNFASNLSLPGYVVNDVLQGNVEDAVHNSFRFLTNTVFGLGGLFDVASEAGVEERQSDFGETLHVWGVREGTYIELPFLGPSTDRDVAGRVGDILLNPLRYVLQPPESYVALGARIASGANSRGQLGETIDSVLYDSADSYAQVRLLYLERRRFQLGGATTPAEDEEFDPNANPFADYE